MHPLLLFRRYVTTFTGLFLTLSPPFLPSLPHLPTPISALVGKGVEEVPIWYTILRVLLLAMEFEGDKLDLLQRLLTNRGTTMTWKGPVTGTDAKNHELLLVALGKFNESHKGALEPLLLAANSSIARAAEVKIEQEILSTEGDNNDTATGLIFTPLSYVDTLDESSIVNSYDLRMWYRTLNNHRKWCDSGIFAL